MKLNKNYFEKKNPNVKSLIYRNYNRILIYLRFLFYTWEIKWSNVIGNKFE